MRYLLLVLHLFIGASLAGVFIVAALVAGQGQAGVLLGAVLAGFALAFPLARAVARAMTGE
jgi:hypothetical protein